MKTARCEYCHGKGSIETCPACGCGTESCEAVTMDCWGAGGKGDAVVRDCFMCQGSGVCRLCTGCQQQVNNAAAEPVCIQCACAAMRGARP